jgi:hypothetical protein
VVSYRSKIDRSHLAIMSKAGIYFDKETLLNDKPQLYDKPSSHQFHDLQKKKLPTAIADLQDHRKNEEDVL